jgi:epsilon-lactone hydrolase
LSGADSKSPKASPLYGDLAGLPPVRVHVGEDEVLLEDSLRFVARAVDAGVDATVDVWHGMPHGFASGVGTFAAASQALAAVGEFLAGRLDASIGEIELR